MKLLKLRNNDSFCWLISHRSACSVIGSCVWYWFSPNLFTGLMQFRSSQAQDQIISGGLAPLRYLDDQGHPTEEYPLNPNGSPRGLAGLCSRDGRHLAMMPHPERCTLGWQWPWAPRDFRASLSPSPWLRMFKNAAAWCSNTEWKYSVYVSGDVKIVLMSCVNWTCYITLSSDTPFYLL